MFDNFGANHHWPPEQEDKLGPGHDDYEIIMVFSRRIKMRTYGASNWKSCDATAGKEFTFRARMEKEEYDGHVDESRMDYVELVEFLYCFIHKMVFWGRFILRGEAAAAKIATGALPRSLVLCRMCKVMIIVVELENCSHIFEKKNY